MEFNEMLRGFFEQVRNESDFLQFLTELKQNNISYYIYFVATGNVKVVTSSDSYVSMKSDRGLIKINSEASGCLTRIAAKRHFTHVTAFDQYCRELARAGVFKWVVDVNEVNRYYWSKDNQLLHTENIINPT
ncbi:DUF1398 domain-containing protein [Kluyvera sichuanensis]|uniref:DUF1398 domain-containing protein n=1 Tax=Kluyvera sichuanensis TaxID=2725494 RepID=A0ABR6RLS7_9ENTR|nr:DUF1398 domain-containing protein [Kluyvera sichuanensis]MBC1184092.1 DUF1398 domain-containing protein [Kluyvera sichuanensis]